MTKLQIAPGLALDADYVGGGTFALLGKKGAGKSFTTRVIAEEFWDHQVPFALIDPMGANWGLRSSADGKHEGIPVPIFGGEHGDAPLERTAGAVMADLLMDGLSMILDLSALGTRAGEKQFGLEFFERLYRNNRTLVHVLLDEADLFAPQKPAAGDQALLGVTENIVRRGRNKGIAITLISQRSAVLNKDVLTQVDGLWLLRITSPQDREAARLWMDGHGEPEQTREVTGSLAHLANGEAWIWIPELRVLKRVQVRMARTFDSSPTRKRGDRIAMPKGYADVDLAAISEKISGSIERAKAEDPRELRRQIATLQRELKAAADASTRAAPEPQIETVEIPVLGDEEIRRLEAASAAAAAAADMFLTASVEISTALVAFRKPLPPRPAVPPPPARVPPRAGGTPTAPPAPVRMPGQAGPSGDGGPSPAQQRILNALASLDVIGVAQPSKTQLALFAQASPKSSGYTNNLGALRTAGLIDYPAPGTAALTAAGAAIADSALAPRTHDELLAYVRQLVGPARSRIVDALVDVYPEALPKDQLADRAGASASSSGYTNNLGSLRSLGLIDYPAPGYAAATAVLFLEAGR